MSPRVRTVRQVVARTVPGIVAISIYVVAVVTGYAVSRRPTRNRVGTSRRRRSRSDALVVIGLVQIILMLVTIALMLRQLPAPSIEVKVMLPAPTAIVSPTPVIVPRNAVRSGAGGADCAPGH